MMWLFAVLVVLAMGGVASGGGSGTPMSEEYDDRPDVARPVRATGGGRATCAGSGSRWRSAATGCRRSTTLLDRLARELEASTSPEAPGEVTAEQAPGADKPAASTNDRPDGIPSGS